MLQNRHAGLGGAGGEAQLLAHKNARVGEVGHAVDIFAGVQTVADKVLVRLQVLGQRPEHKYAVDFIVGIDFVDDLQQFLLAHVLRQYEFLYRDAQGLRSLAGGALIAEVVGPLAAADDSHGGEYALGLEGLALGDNAGVKLLVYFLA